MGASKATSRSSVDKSSEAVAPPRIKSNYTSGRKWATLGAVVGSLAAIAGVLAMIALKTDLTSKMDFLKDLKVPGSIALMGGGALLSLGSVFYLHRTKYLPVVAMDDEIHAFVKQGEFFIFNDGAKKQMVQVGDFTTFADAQKRGTQVSIGTLRDRLEASKKEARAQAADSERGDAPSSPTDSNQNSKTRGPLAGDESDGDDDALGLGADEADAPAKFQNGGTRIGVANRK